jgi:hypothetical protein
VLPYGTTVRLYYGCSTVQSYSVLRFCPSARRTDQRESEGSYRLDFPAGDQMRPSTVGILQLSPHSAEKLSQTFLLNEVTGATAGYHKDSIAVRLKNNIMIIYYIIYYILYILIYRASNKRLHNTAFDPVTASLRSLNAAESCLTVILRTTSADSSVMAPPQCRFADVSWSAGNAFLMT